MENIQKLLCEMQVHFNCACKNTRLNAPSGCNSLKTIQLAPFSQRCAVRTAHSIICRYNCIADYTIMMLVHKIM